MRPVLDSYKAQRGEDKVLETFRLNQAHLLAEEERRREQMDQLARQGARRGLGGPISTFSLSRKHQVRNVTVLLFCVTRKCLYHLESSLSKSENAIVHTLSKNRPKIDF